MSKDGLDKASDAIKRGVDDVKDTIHETQHRSAAEGEKARRKALDDELTTGEKVGSAIHEAKHRTQAEIDKAKREARDRTG
jgi:glycerol-3-phosphate O-acyltransferase